MKGQGRTTPIGVPTCTTVLQLKELVQDGIGVPVQCLRLVHQRARLKNEDTLWGSGVRSGSCIRIVQTGGGGMGVVVQLEGGGEDVSLTVKAASTIRQVKLMLADILKVAPVDQDLSFNGTTLDNCTTLREVGATNGSVFVASVRAKPCIITVRTITGKVCVLTVPKRMELDNFQTLLAAKGMGPPKEQILFYKGKRLKEGTIGDFLQGEEQGLVLMLTMSR